MPIQTPDATYDANIVNWQRLRATYEGEDAVKAAGTRYLREFYPAMAVQERQRWLQFLNHSAQFPNIVKRVHSVLSGAMLRTEPSLAVADDQQDFVDYHFGTANTGIHSLIQEVISEDILTGRTGILIDVDPTPGSTPYPTVYRAEQIIAVEGEVVGGEQEISHARLQTTVMVPKDDDPYVKEEKKQILELGLSEEGYYFQRLWQEAQGENDFQIVIREGGDELGRVFPTDFFGRPLLRIPFWIANGTVDTIWSPLSDIARENIHIYNMVSYRNWSYYQQNTPTYILSGVGENDGELYLGGVFRSSSPEADLKVLSGAPDVLRAAQNVIDQTFNTIAAQGASMFSMRGNQSQVESGVALEIRNAPESSVIGALAMSYSATLSSVLRFALQWHTGVEQNNEVGIRIHNSINPENVEPQVLTAIITGVVNGVVPPDAMYEALQRVDLLPEDFDPVADVDRIENAAPTVDDPELPQ